MLKEEESSKSLCPPLCEEPNPGGDCDEQKSHSPDEKTLERESMGSPNEWTSSKEGGGTHHAFRYLFNWKSSRTFSVLDYGAKGDGTNDDTKVNEQFYGLAA
ncbi:hypothetical protein F2Q69_00027929 [Brassica cretica]|uniref:Uncharacterized protein n=1 Tax=Brassica cretica TaxID=69181 RepID=A0A8S9S9N8_BRACR|nr:hypothetical protein F2Q69_00027929 [Brassica cretica]